MVHVRAAQGPQSYRCAPAGRYTRRTPSWSINASSADYGSATFPQRIEGIFDTLIHLPARTRWNRMLRTVH